MAKNNNSRNLKYLPNRSLHSFTFSPLLFNLYLGNNFFFFFEWCLEKYSWHAIFTSTQAESAAMFRYYKQKKLELIISVGCLV